jgi:hypothetical protein
VVQGNEIGVLFMAAREIAKPIDLTSGGGMSRLMLQI